MSDPILAPLEVYPLPAEALEGVSTWASRPQEGRHQTSSSANEAGLSWVHKRGKNPRPCLESFSHTSLVGSQKKKKKKVYRGEGWAVTRDFCINVIFLLLIFWKTLSWDFCSPSRRHVSYSPFSWALWKRSPKSREWNFSSDQKTQILLKGTFGLSSGLVQAEIPEHKRGASWCDLGSSSIPTRSRWLQI